VQPQTSADMPLRVIPWAYPSAVLEAGRFLFSSWKEVRELTVVNLRNNESQEQLLKRFRKKVVKSGVLSTVRRKRWFVSKSEQRRMEQKKSMRRYKRRVVKDYE
jgi:small subunit ribosomal protein S21